MELPEIVSDPFAVAVLLAAEVLEYEDELPPPPQAANEMHPMKVSTAETRVLRNMNIPLSKQIRRGVFYGKKTDGAIVARRRPIGSACASNVMRYEARSSSRGRG